MARPPWQDEVHLVVVGASVGGLLAAVTVADRGGRVVVVERTKEVGGGAAREAELLPAPGSRFQTAAGVEDTPAALADELIAADATLDPTVARALAEQGAAIAAWLADRCSAAVEHLPRLDGGHRAARLHALGERGGASLVADLARAATRHSRIAVRAGAVAEHLVRDDAGGAVVGVALRSDRRGAGHAVAGRVLLACGGFGADDDLVARHCPAAAELPFRPAGDGAGEGLRLGLEVGAWTRALAVCPVTPFLAVPAEVAVGRALVRLGALLVNQAGRRFADETAAAPVLARALRAQPGGVAYLLFDERIADAARAADPFFARVVLPRTGRRGASPAELARQLELDAAGLAATAAGESGEVAGRSAPLEPPLHAIRVTAGRRQTRGGIAVDAAARVLDADGRPIPGLYATAGAAAGVAADDGDALLGIDTLAALGLARLAALDVIAALRASAE
jgi:fumarate reductase flavoprotein subunit